MERGALPRGRRRGGAAAAAAAAAAWYGGRPPRSQPGARCPSGKLHLARTCLSRLLRRWGREGRSSSSRRGAGGRPEQAPKGRRREREAPPRATLKAVPAPRATGRPRRPRRPRRDPLLPQVPLRTATARQQLAGRGGGGRAVCLSRLPRPRSFPAPRGDAAAGQLRQPSRGCVAAPPGARGR